jgi:hypothetical protein
LASNPDVEALIRQGFYAIGSEQYIKEGRDEGRRKGLPMRWTEDAYLAANPDVAADVAAGKFSSGQEEDMKIGVLKNREGAFSGWDEEGYLIAKAVAAKIFHSGFEHFLKWGAKEGRHFSLGA